MARPITLSRKDVLSPDTLRQIISHDEAGLALGCWKTPDAVPTE